MQFKQVDKARYQKRLNTVVVGSIATLTIVSLGLSQLLIALYPDESGSHFNWNFLGVVVGCITVGLLFKKFKNHTYMSDVYYVWQLKQTINQIHRKLAKVKLAVEQDDVNAMIVLNYYYQACRKLWQLDDNTITIEELGVWQSALNTRADGLNLELQVEDFQLELLAQY